MVIDDTVSTVNHTANVMSNCHKQVEDILHKELGMSKVSACRVPWYLTPDQKLTRLVMSEVNLAMFKADPDDFVERFFTQNKC